MRKLWTPLLAAIAILSMSPAVAGQTISVSGGVILTPGEEVTVSFSGGTPGETITVEMDDGEDKADSVNITLDANGNGSTTWVVPGWDGVNFEAPDAPTLTRMIGDQPSDGTELRSDSPAG